MSYRQYSRSVSTELWLEQWLRQHLPKVIHPELMKVYQEYANVLPSEFATVRAGPLQGPYFTAKEIGEHMEKGDDIGQDWVLTFYEGTYHGLSPEDQQRARENPEYLIQRTIEKFRDVSEKHKSGEFKQSESTTK